MNQKRSENVLSYDCFGIIRARNLKYDMLDTFKTPNSFKKIEISKGEMNGKRCNIMITLEV